MALGKDMTVPEYNIVSVTENDARTNDSSIRVLTNILDNCPTPHELRENMSKRLSRNKRVDSGPDLCVVGMLCLASYDYSVSHFSLHGISERDMLKVWSHLERQAVSSSYQLRLWMRSLIGTRTCEGYMARWSISRSFGPNIGNSHVRRGLWEHCIDVTHDMAYNIYGQPATVLEAVRDDITVCNKVSSNNQRCLSLQLARARDDFHQVDREQ